MSIFDRAAGVLAMAPRPQMIQASKAVTISSAPTIVEPECSDRLIDFVQEESVLVGLMRVIRMSRNEQNLNFIDVSNKLLRPGGCQTTCDTGTITGTRKTLSVHELKAAIPLCDDVLDTNIEGAALEDHLLRMAAKQLANELEVWVLMASLGLGQSPAYTSTLVDASAMLLDDNLYEQLQGGHVLNALTATDTRFITACKVQQMMQALPTQYRGNRNLKLFMPDDMIWDWNGVVRARQTPGGDAQFSGQVDPQLGRLPFVSVPLLPTNILSCSVGSAVGSNGTFMFLADPDNLVLGIQREMTFERWRNGCEGRTFLIWTIRVDVLIENQDATVLYDCMDVGSCACEPCP
jgi:hypothetical protein